MISKGVVSLSRPSDILRKVLVGCSLFQAEVIMYWRLYTKVNGTRLCGLRSQYTRVSNHILDKSSIGTDRAKPTPDPMSQSLAESG